MHANWHRVCLIHKMFIKYLLNSSCEMQRWINAKFRKIDLKFFFFSKLDSNFLGIGKCDSFFQPMTPYSVNKLRRNKYMPIKVIMLYIRKCFPNMIQLSSL